MKTEQILEACKSKLAGVGKHKYALLILLVGIGLMLYPFGEKQQTEHTEIIEKEISMEEKLEDILSRADGVGSVKVLLSLKEGPLYTYQTDEHVITEETQQEQELETVLIRNENGGEAPIVTHTRYPVYEGAVVVCEGAENPSVRLYIVNAVSDLTGLGSDKISVIKMRGN